MHDKVTQSLYRRMRNRTAADNPQNGYKYSTRSHTSSQSTMGEKGEKTPDSCNHPKLSTGVILGLVLHVLVICVLTYREVYISDRFEKVMTDNERLQNEIANINQV